MEHFKTGGIEIIFDQDDRACVDLFAEVCTGGVPLIEKLWGLKTPPGCAVYIMTSWRDFLFRSAAWPRKIAYALVLPVLIPRFRRSWPKIAGWTLLNQPIIGIKAPGLLAAADTEIGRQIYIREPDLNRKAQMSLCHELAHAFSIHLKLPLWLNEGLAMLTVDRYYEKVTVRSETLKFLEPHPHKRRMLNYRKLMSGDVDSILYSYIRSYWLVRYFELRHPGLLKGLLGKRRNEREWMEHLSAAEDISPKRFWDEIDSKILAQFVG